MQHAIAHMLGGSYGVEHGTAHAVVLPYVTDHLSERAPVARWPHRRRRRHRRSGRLPLGSEHPRRTAGAADRRRVLRRGRRPRRPSRPRPTAGRPIRTSTTPAAPETRRPSPTPRCGPSCGPPSPVDDPAARDEGLPGRRGGRTRRRSAAAPARPMGDRRIALVCSRLGPASTIGSTADDAVVSLRFTREIPRPAVPPAAGARRGSRPDRLRGAVAGDQLGGQRRRTRGADRGVRPGPPAGVGDPCHGAAGVVRSAGLAVALP